MEIVICSLSNDPDNFPIKLLCERDLYQGIPGSKMKVRFDKVNNSTKTQHHAHVFAQNGKQQLFAVNRDGSAHDRSHQVKLPSKIADLLRDNGYDIPIGNYIETMDLVDRSYYYQIKLKISNQKGISLND